jgi:hypothetical protein
MAQYVAISRRYLGVDAEGAAAKTSFTTIPIGGEETFRIDWRDMRGPTGPAVCCRFCPLVFRRNLPENVSAVVRVRSLAAPVRASGQ